MKVLFIGAGRWGLALASALAGNGHDVLLLSRDLAEGKQLNDLGTHPYFPDAHFPGNMKMTDDEGMAEGYSDVAVLSLPVQVSFGYLKERRGLIKGKKLLLTGKGMVGEKILSDVLSPLLEDTSISVLSGPSFAAEVVERKPTCVSIASESKGDASFFQSLFSSSFFRPYLSEDVKGLELCGALKNVYAIGAGLIERRLGSANTRAAYLTRALHEISRLVALRGGRKETVYGLSGVGDLFMTCTSPLSRNFQFGYHFLEPGYKTNGVAEGVYTLSSLESSLPDFPSLLPIAHVISSLVRGELTFEQGIEKLMLRDLKGESE